MENFLRGRKKAVWISVGPDLLEDARRDLRDIGAGAIHVHDLKAWNATKKLSTVGACTEGVLFCTYTLLASNMDKESHVDGDGSATEQHKSRLRQIVEWCGPDFDGVVSRLRISALALMCGARSNDLAWVPDVGVAWSCRGRSLLTRRIRPRT